MNKQKLYELKNNRKQSLDAAKEALSGKDMDTYKAKMAEVNAFNEEIDATEKLLAEEGRFDEGDGAMVSLSQQQAQQKEELAKMSRVDEVRTGNEYARAFCKALASGMTPKAALHREEFAPLTKALSEGTGNDGGFLVPIDFDTMIQKKMKEFVRLSDLFRVETVNALSGWRVVETSAARKAMPQVNEAATIGTDDQPAFTKVEYSVKKYADRLSVSNELMEDNTAGLMQYLADWFGPKVIMTENALLLALLDKLTLTPFTAGKEVSELKKLLNTGLNTYHSRNAHILTNPIGYDTMDQWEDKNGRAMLVPLPTDPDVYRFKGRPISYADLDEIPNVTLTKGSAKTTYAPVYVGDFASFGTLFRRKALEFAATNIGGNAWATDSTEVRGIVRMDAQSVDTAAAVLMGLAQPAEAE